MTVRTQDSQVLKPVVGPIAVDVVELEWNRLPAPFNSSTTLTTLLFQAFLDESAAEGSSASIVRILDEDFIKGLAFPCGDASAVASIPGR